MRLFGIFFITLLALSLSRMQPVLADSEQTPACSGDSQVCALPYLIGLVMGDSRYPDLIKSVEAQVPSGGFLVVAGYTSVQLNGTIFVYLNLEQHARFSRTTKIIGQIVGEVIAAPGPGYEVTAIYFKPAASTPGGISVGNQ